MKACGCVIKNRKLISVCKIHGDWRTKQCGDAYIAGAEHALAQAAWAAKAAVEKIKAKEVC